VILESLTQRPLVEFADAGLGNRLDEHHIVRQPPFGHARSEKIQDLLLRDLVPVHTPPGVARYYPTGRGLLLRDTGSLRPLLLCFYYNRIMVTMATKPTEEEITRFADMFSAMGTGPRLRIMRVLLSAHPDGMVVGEIGSDLGIAASTLSHHLEKLKNEGLVKVRREGTYLWYSANAEVLQELLGFLYAECCTRNKAVEPQAIVRLCR
jgi:ArsR family transcriptional regulator, arsenate/arsenite/antimonite-responsive transcriptional repressor